MADPTAKIRYDQWVKFHNPTARDFVGKWDGEEYLIKAGGTQIFPVWLARHFAKRLCDDEMIKKYRVPLRPGDERRVAFITTLAPVDLTDIDTTPNKRKVSMKEQIETDREVHLEAEAEEGAVLHPDTGTDQIPIGDDELAEEPPKTESELAQEVAQENLVAGKAGGRATLGRNPAGAGEARDVEFGGELGNIPTVAPPSSGSGFASRSR